MAIRKQLIGAFAAALLGATALGGAPATAEEFDMVYSFGDSLTDTGNFFVFSKTADLNMDGFLDLDADGDGTVSDFEAVPPEPFYFQGRSTNGQVWIEYFACAGQVDADLVNFAIAGANTDTTGVFPGTNGSVILPTGVSGALQVGGLSAPFEFGSDDLITLWAGANDIVFGANTPAGAVANLATAVEDLNALGAENFLVLNLPDLGKTPDGAGSGFAPMLTAAAATHNGLLRAMMSTLDRQLGVDILVVDVHTAFNQILANPDAFGFTNTTDPCLDLANGTICSFDPAIQNTYVSWDGFHPTTAAHELIAEFAFTTLTTPSRGLVVARAHSELGAESSAQTSDAVALRLAAARLGVSGFGLLGNGFAGSSTLEQRLSMAGGDDGRAAASDGVWMPLSAGDAAPAATDPRLSLYVYRNDDGGTQAATGSAAGFGYSTETRSIGMDYRLGDKILVGMAYGQADTLATIEGGASAEVVSDGVTVYGAYTDGGFFANAQLGMSEDHYADVARATGSWLFPVAAGSTDGRTTHGDFETGYGFAAGPVTFGPSVGARWTRSEIDGYGETGAGPLNLTYGDQRSETLTGLLGFQAAAMFETATGPLAAEFGATWSRDLAGGGAASASLPDGYTKSLTGVDAGGDAVDLNAGAAMHLAPGLTGLVELRSSFGAAEGDSHEAHASVTLRF